MTKEELEDLSPEEYLEHVLSSLKKRGIDISRVSTSRISKAYSEGLDPSVITAIEYEKSKVMKR